MPITFRFSEALREVEWSTSPCSLAEFFSRFTFPRSFSKWMSHLKCNLYYYKTNYFILLIFVLGLALITRPLAILGAALTALSLAFLNDSFAATFNEKVIRTIRHFSPHLAAKMRPPHMPVIRGRSATRKTVYVCGQPRLVFVLIGLTVILLHTTLRTPNLKALLNTFREESGLSGATTMNFKVSWKHLFDLEAKPNRDITVSTKDMKLQFLPSYAQTIGVILVVLVSFVFGRLLVDDDVNIFKEI